MKQAIIDIGSNSMRLTVYEVAGETFKILFREKSMAGLAGYVEEGRLSPEGIARACSGLLEFRETLAALDITAVAVFATASLRNIFNTAEAVWAIQTATGFSVEVLSGTEEALLGYYGAGLEVHCTSGAFLDIGGGSTEVVVFDQGQPGSVRQLSDGIAEPVPVLCEEDPAGGWRTEADERGHRGNGGGKSAAGLLPTHTSDLRGRHGARRPEAVQKGVPPDPRAAAPSQWSSWKGCARRWRLATRTPLTCCCAMYRSASTPWCLACSFCATWDGCLRQRSWWCVNTG